MRLITIFSVIFGISLVPLCVAQEWEVGGAAGFGIIKNASIDNSSGSVTAGFNNQFAASAAVGQDLYEHFSGELRYTYRDDDLVIRSGGQKVNMNGDSHLVHYDTLFHLLPKSARIRPFAAAGAGIRLFRATGHEYTGQPFSDFAFLTTTKEVKPLISAGAGLKAKVSDHTLIRVDFREYISPFPENLFAVAPGAKIHGWLFDSVPMAGVSFVF